MESYCLVFVSDLITHCPEIPMWIMSLRWAGWELHWNIITNVWRSWAESFVCTYDRLLKHIFTYVDKLRRFWNNNVYPSPHKSTRWWWSDAQCPQTSVDILGTSCDQCRSTVQYSFTSTETRRLIRTDSPGPPPRLSHSSWTMKSIRGGEVMLNVLRCQLTY